MSKERFSRPASGLPNLRWHRLSCHDEATDLDGCWASQGGQVDRVGQVDPEVQDLGEITLLHSRTPIKDHLKSDLIPILCVLHVKRCGGNTWAPILPGGRGQSRSQISPPLALSVCTVTRAALGAAVQWEGSIKSTPSMLGP